MMKNIVLAAILISFLSACEETVEDEEKKILSFYAKNSHGGDTDYGLYSKGIIIRSEYLIGTISGVSDDQATCQEIANFFNEKEPNTYFCKPLN